jgi:hypothetical protein
LLLGSAVAALVAGFTLGPAAVALAAEPSPSTSASTGGGTGASSGPKVGQPTPGVAGCALPNNLENVTGMVATDKGIFVVEGGDTDQVTFFLLDANCKAVLNIFSGANPLNPQDLGLASDGSVVVADIGDSEEATPSRPRIAIETALPDGNTAKTFRFQYPGGAKFDAQAMVLDKGDVPIVFAHEASGVTGIYKPAKALEAEITENLPQLAKIGTFTPANTNTPNPKGAAGNAQVTGAAKSPDGKHVVVRTLSDAYEYEVGADGDVAKALTTTPVVTPLPNEPDGQAITYSADGTKFITVSVGAGATLMTYTKYVPPPVTEEPAPPADETPVDEGGILSKIKNLGFNEMTRIIAAVGVVGLVLAIAGIIGIRRARRRRREEEEYDDYDDYDDDPRPRRGRGRGRDDDHGYGVREPAYSGGYDDQGGYGAEQYGAGGYANGYAGGGQYAEQYGAAGYGEAGYADPAYGGQQYADNGYGAQGYGADQYGGQQYGADQYGGQQYGDYGQGQYGGYGYEEDFDPMQDPRRQ